MRDNGSWRSLVR